MGGMRNADDMAGFVETSWDVRGLDKIGGPEKCARERVERKSRTGIRRDMVIIKHLEYETITDDTMARRRRRRRGRLRVS